MAKAKASTALKERLKELKNLKNKNVSINPHIPKFLQPFSYLFYLEKRH
jgi:hypothetical protein